MKSNFKLKPFEDISPVPQEIFGEIEIQHQGDVVVTYRLKEPGSVQIPSPSAHPSRKNNLWEKTCFEIFFKPQRTDQYCEYNFSPEGDWNIFYFSEYRSLSEVEFEDLAPTIEIQGNESSFSLTARFQLPSKWLSSNHFHVGISAVIQDRKGGNLTYWALHHPNSKPDFHDPKGFVLDIIRR